MTNALKTWCAGCFTCYPDLPAARACTCGLPIPALRGEYVLTLAQVDQNRGRPCQACAAPVIWVRGSKGGKVPLARARARSVDCATCRPPGAPPDVLPSPTCRACLGRGRHYLVPTHYADCTAAGSFRKKARP